MPFEYRYFDELEGISIRIETLKNSIAMSNCHFEKNCYEGEIAKEISRAADIIKTFQRSQEKQEDKYFRQAKEFTLEELAAFNGIDGKPAYIAVDGVVYDVTSEPTWGGASHFGLIAGRDVTQEFNRCHGGAAVLSKLPRVGIIRL